MSLTPSARLALRVLGGLQRGELRIVWSDGTEHVFKGEEPGPSGTLVVRDPSAARRMVLGGGMGFAEGYLEREWDTPDLVSLLDLLAQNSRARAAKGHRSPMQPINTMIHRLRPNTRSGSRKNIAYHYDVGNDFYELWLDPTYTYSCGLFPEGTGSDPGPADPVALEQAQLAKWERLLSLLGPRPGATMLEIGCGWGGFAIHAAQTRGCHVTGITLSKEQLNLANERVREAGLEGQVELRLQDYRDVREVYDYIASIEMFEAVGEAYWPTYFAAVRSCLRPGGKAGLQVITIDDDRFESYRRHADFIQKYIFPGGMLPSPKAFRQHAEAAGLSMEEPAFFGWSYAATLSCWLQRFDAVSDQVKALGYDERFRRMWRYYLAYCIAGFRNRMIDVMQVALT